MDDGIKWLRLTRDETGFVWCYFEHAHREIPVSLAILYTPESGASSVEVDGVPLPRDWGLRPAIEAYVAAHQAELLTAFEQTPITEDDEPDEPEPNCCVSGCMFCVGG